MTTSRRKFLKAGAATGAAAGAAVLGAPAIVKAAAPIKWRLQTYAGPALGVEVIDQCIKDFNQIAQSMEAKLEG